MSKTKVDSTGIDLTDNFAFTGTVSGTPGITVADQWYMGTAFQGSNADITSNWTSTMPYTGYGVIGSAVTESSGIFTFPSTGIWRISHHTYIQFEGADLIVQIQYNFSTDSGSSYDTENAPLVGLGAISDTLDRQQHSFTATYDVTNASTARFKMSTSSIASTTTVAPIYLTFTRLGDT